MSTGRRTLVQGHCLAVIECMSSAARAASTEHVRVMIDDALRGIRHVIDVVEHEDLRQRVPPQESNGKPGNP